MTSLLCQVASFTNVAEAEFARCRLGFEGIQARLDNANLVLWFWVYSQVTGGVKVLVRANQAERAREILDEPTPARQPAEAWRCDACGEESPGDWDVCWRCMALHGEPQAVEIPDDLPETPERPATASCCGKSLFKLILFGLFGLVAYASLYGDWFYGLTAWLFTLCVLAILVYLVFVNVDKESKPTSDADWDTEPEPEPVLTAAEQSQERRRAMGSYLAKRAWRITIFSYLYFPPLMLGSFATLLRIKPRRMLLSGPDLMRYWGAWVLNLAFPFLFFLPAATLPVIIPIYPFLPSC